MSAMRRRVSGLLFALGLGVVGAAQAACGAAPIDAVGPMRLAASDPELLLRARSMVFAVSTTKTCAELIDLRPDALQAAFDLDVQAPIVAVPLVDGHLVDPAGAPMVGYTFGAVKPDRATAYVVLTSTSGVESATSVRLDAFVGTVTGIGCRDFVARAGKRDDLPIALFPAGLR